MLVATTGQSAQKKKEWEPKEKEYRRKAAEFKDKANQNRNQAAMIVESAISKNFAKEGFIFGYNWNC